VLHDGCRTVSLEASPYSLEPQENTHRTVKSSEEYVEEREEHQGKVGKLKGQPNMQEKHQRRDTDRKDGTHQRQHLVMSASYE
jgi:hypothetical protein